MTWGRKKRTPPTPTAITHQVEHPVKFADANRWRTFRKWTITTSIITIIAAGSGFLVYGPFYDINKIEVRGTVKLDAASIKRTAEKQIRSYAYLIWPRRNIKFFPTNEFTNWLSKKIRGRLSIEDLKIARDIPQRTLIINITERTPIFLWSSNNRLATVDRNGVVIETATPGNPVLTKVIDERLGQLVVDSSVVKPSELTDLIKLKDLLTSRQLTIENFVVPLPKCLPVSDLAITVINESDKTALNVNETAVDTNINTNLNINSRPMGNLEPCPTDNRIGPEINFKLVDGPKIMVDRQTDLQRAIKTLVELLKDPKNWKAEYIDLRFIDQVFIK